jgi:hypothetical protein
VLRADRTAGMPKTARFSVYMGVQLDAIEDVLSLLLEAEALGAEVLADLDERECKAHGADVDSREVRRRLMALRGTEDIRRVPRR